jgi:hypothetical protein
MPWGRPPGSRPRSPDARRESQSTHEMLGADSLGICHGRTTPAGCHYHRGQAACAAGARRRRRGLPVSGQGQSTSPTPTRNTPQGHPGHPLAGPRAAGQTLSPPDGPRHTCQPGGRGHGPCAGRLSVGHGHTGPRDPVTASPHGEERHPSLRRLPPGLGRGAAPGGCTPRRRAEAARTPRASRAAGTRRPPGRGASTHGEPQAHPSRFPGVGASDAPRTKQSCRPKKICPQLLTSEVISDAPGELRPTAEHAKNIPQSLRCGPSAPGGC